MSHWSRSNGKAAARRNYKEASQTAGCLLLCTGLVIVKIVLWAIEMFQLRQINKANASYSKPAPKGRLLKRSAEELFEIYKPGARLSSLLKEHIKPRKGVYLPAHITVPVRLGLERVERVEDFDGREEIESVVLEKGYKEIGYGAFKDCKGLKKVVIPSTVEEIAFNAFSGCTSLMDIEVDGCDNTIGTVKQLLRAAEDTPWFKDATGCRSLGRMLALYKGDDSCIVVPNNIEYIAPNVFRDCRNLTEVVLPEGLKKIDAGAFWGCENLLRINVPQSLEFIANDAFQGCACLNEVLLPPDMRIDTLGAFQDTPWFDSLEDRLIIGDKLVCAGITEDMVVIPEGITKISEAVFRGRKEIKTIRFPTTLQEIGTSAFEGCEGIAELIMPDAVEVVADSAFRNCRSLKIVSFSASLKQIGESAFEKCVSITKLSIPGSVAEVGKSAFKGCENLRELIISEGVTSLSAGCFSNCPMIQNVFLPDSLESIGADAFSNCASILEVYLPPKIRVLENNLFMGCGMLSRVIMPLELRVIKQNAFDGCRSLTRLHIPQKVSEINAYAFRNSGINTIRIPRSVTKIMKTSFPKGTTFAVVRGSESERICKKNGVPIEYYVHEEKEAEVDIKKGNYFIGG